MILIVEYCANVCLFPVFFHYILLQNRKKLSENIPALPVRWKISKTASRFISGKKRYSQSRQLATSMYASKQIQVSKYWVLCSNL